MTYTLANDQLRAVLTDVGARLLELHVPGRDGVTADVVLGRPDLATAATDDNYMGATAGRYANRIRGGRFHLDGVEHQLSVNEGANHLHGGRTGFDLNGRAATGSRSAGFPRPARRAIRAS
jgi:aldose 1-epimerase